MDSLALVIRPRRAPWLARVGTVALAALLAWAASARHWDPDRFAASAAQYGPQATRGAADLRALMSRLEGADERAQLRAVNDFFNQRLAYREDIDNWGQVDYWATPLESLSKGAGDCEDYALAKYFTLVSLGVPDERLRLVYVRARLPGAPGEPPAGPRAHMVLAWYARPDAVPLVLDNLDGRVRPASARHDLTPVFSFNADGLWQGVGSIRAEGAPLARLSRWRDVYVRAREEGFR